MMNVRIQVIFSLLFLIAASHSSVSGTFDPDRFNNVVVSEYEIEDKPYFAVLEMEYADFEIKNPILWKTDRRKKKVYEVDLVYTNYPKNKADWLTNYDTLLQKRIDAITSLIPQLKEDSLVKWNLVLQTDCPDAESAKNMFHGAVVKYRVKLSKGLRIAMSSVRDIIIGKKSFEDSVVFRAFERNPDWEDMLVVNDWTGSMYDYCAQAVLWHRLHGEQEKIKYLVFFNDGNQKINNQKEIGKTGGIYAARADSIKEIITVMKDVMVGGAGGDDPENDIEAMLYGINKFDDFGELVLIADNKSAVRDLELLPKINRPVRIILCGLTEKKGIHPDYLKIARETKGSIHTISDDLINLAETQEGEIIEALGLRYRLTKGNFDQVDRL
ncbi:hypothetical protein R9C00_26850 [Flammeovirgaceae bacterium SG7u.111]|nr:hypothetical protein [Flammeovirgaceae bacterium SG7u.132]WPO35319.1 hypothetical protein R9C00_26850 [Flammeovirgaceae bacterium SG7u.111]